MRKIKFQQTVELSDELIFEINKKVATIKDYRDESYTRHLLVDAVMITFFAMLTIANEWADIELFAKAKEKWLRKYLELPYGIPMIPYDLLLAILTQIIFIP